MVEDYSPKIQNLESIKYFQGRNLAFRQLLMDWSDDIGIFARQNLFASLKQCTMKKCP